MGMSGVCDFRRICMEEGQSVADFLNLSASTHHLTLYEGWRWGGGGGGDERGV